MIINQYICPLHALINVFYHVIINILINCGSLFDYLHNLKRLVIAIIVRDGSTIFFNLKDGSTYLFILKSK